MAYDINCLNVLYSSDDNYVRHMGASICSLLEHHRDFERVVIYVIDNEINPHNVRKLEELVDEYPNAELRRISFEAWKGQLVLDLAWPISLSSYARLFVSGMLPETVERVLYLDCDMIICDSLREIWQLEMEEAYVAAVQDFVNDSTKRAVGLLPEEQYLNSGLLLIDLKKWRELGMQQACLDFIESHQGNVTHHDQGTLNGVLRGAWKRLPLRYNLMTIHFIFNRRKLQKFYGDHADFYPEEEIAAAKKTPAILHYTPSFTSRPWVTNCRHPLRKKYWNMLRLTPWSEAKREKSNEKWYVRLINWRYRCLPY